MENHLKSSHLQQDRHAFIPASGPTSGGSKRISANTSGRNSTLLTASIDELGGKQATQASGAFGQQTADQGILRDELEEELRDINLTAASIAEETGNSALMERFRMPHGQSDNDLAASTRAIAAAIAGAEGKMCVTLPSGTPIKVGEPTFHCDFDSSGKIVNITPYVVTNIWQFPDGRVKLRATMTRDSTKKIEQDDVDWFITDWYPALGETKADWLNACQRAGANKDYGSP